MIEKTFRVQNKLGLHARPAAQLVQALQKFESYVRVRKDDQEVDAKSIMGILTLTAEFGSQLTFVAEGPDEEAVINGMDDFFRQQAIED